MRLSVIIPLYNEAGVITSTLERLVRTEMPDFVESMEIIVVDDCSTDGSAERVRSYSGGKKKIRLVLLDVNSGKGAAVAHGIALSHGDTIMIQDADLELDPADIPRLLRELHDGGSDLVSGTRFRSGKRYPLYSLAATTANRLFSLVASLLTGKRVTDITCGHKLFTRQLYDRLCLKEKRFGFETELVLRTLKEKDSSYSECDVEYVPRRRGEGKKISATDGLLIAGKTLKYGLTGRRWISAVAIAVIIGIMGLNMLSSGFWKEEKRVIEWDVISYYAYLPATFIYHDLSLSFIDHYSGPHNFIFWPERTDEGDYVIKTTMGLSMLWLPFFAAGHITAILTGADTGGYSPPYKFFLLLGALTWLLAGLIYLRRILLSLFSDRISALVIAGFALGTNLYWYTLFQGTMSHVYSFALTAMFIWYVTRWYAPREQGRESRNSHYMLQSAVRIGILAGLISLIRPTNIIILLFFLLYGVYSRRQVTERVTLLAGDFRYLVVMAVAALVVWMPQLFYWKEITGHWLYFSYGGDERFFFGDPAIIKGLFSWRKGLLIYTPLLFFSFAGIITLWRGRSPYALPVTIFVPVNIYIIFSWWCWWYGGGFGQRAFIDSYALMAVAAAAFLSGTATAPLLRRRVATACYVVVMTAGIFNNIQYYHGAIHWDSMTRAAYFDSVGRVRPSARFNSLLEAPDYDKAREGEDR